jgi:hypothetical protein
MPTRWAQENYWNQSSTVVVPEQPAGPGGYPVWQASNVAGSGFGVIGAWVSTVWAQLVWWLRLKSRVGRLSPDQVQVVLETLDALEAGTPHRPPPEIVTQTVIKEIPVIQTVIKSPKPSTFRAWWQRSQRIQALDRREQAVLERTLAILESPAYQSAKQAVYQTATTLKFTRPEAWIPYSRALKADPGRAENVFRHVRAMDLTDALTRARGSTLSHPELNLSVELAYHAYTVEPWSIH